MDLMLTAPAAATCLPTQHVDLGPQADAALRSRMVIGQAVGILMQRDGLDSDAAFAWLVDTSQRTNTKLREVARQLVDRLDGTNRRR
ncbi:ANTAR domain-containing protein [uncultured Friedmanniella sp.]|uniref:ANTAR domain-containing protein n=1 Tax=uncultured Friedmanniella sp. TaxID=335381 RepID=UPI0035C9BD4E